MTRHTIKSENTIVFNDMFNDLDGPFEGCRLVLKANLDQLKRHNLQMMREFASSNTWEMAMHTTKLSVAPAEQPVKIDSVWFISVRPLICLKVLPQKSFAATIRQAVGCPNPLVEAFQKYTYTSSHAWVPLEVTAGQDLCTTARI